MTYLSLQAVHLIFVVAWMAGLLVFPRYKVHQLQASPGEPLFETMKTASGQLRRIILTPSLILVWALGLTMLWLNPGLLQAGWFHAKLLLVVALSGLHGYFIALGRKVDAGGEGVSAGRLRMLNEVPFVLMILVILLAVVKPF